MKNYLIILLFLTLSFKLHSQRIYGSFSLGDNELGIGFDQLLGRKNSVGMQVDYIPFAGLISYRAEIYYRHFYKAYRDFPNAYYYQIRLGRGTYRGYSNKWVVPDYSVGFFWGQHLDYKKSHCDVYLGIRLSSLYLPNNWHLNPFKHYAEWSWAFSCPFVVGVNYGKYLVKPKY
jgi:hypothetical protein